MFKSENGKMWKYILFTYLLFWFMVLGVCGAAVMLFGASDATMRWLVSLCSWTPTVVLLLMFKKLNPESSIKSFYKKLFSEKIKIRVLILATLVVVGVFLVSAISIAVFSGKLISTQLQFAAPVLLGNIFFTMIQGASGEESGWRGYLLAKMENRYGFVKGNLVLGFVWAFWHLPLWFVSSGYGGLDLLVYILCFVVGLVAFSMLMGVFMKKWNNLFLAFWMHFLFNFVLSFFIGQDILLLLGLAVFYTLTSTVFVLLHLKKEKSHALNKDFA